MMAETRERSSYLVIHHHGITGTLQQPRVNDCAAIRETRRPTIVCFVGNRGVRSIISHFLIVTTGFAVLVSPLHSAPTRIPQI